MADVNRGNLVYPSEPINFDHRSLDALLVWCAENKISDIMFKSGSGVMVKSQGRRYKITKRGMSTPEVNGILDLMYGANGSAMVAGGRDVDCSYQVKPDRYTCYRFRVNGTGCSHEGHQGMEIVVRTIASIPPSYKSLGFPEFLVDAMHKTQGMVLITGETGSGKSTLLASVIRSFVEDEDANLHVLTYESPIEFTYDEVNMPSSLVTQTEIPTHLGGFDLGIRNAMRRDPDMILVGESRDAVTMAASIEAARTGHLLMTTMHTNGVASTIRRAVGMFPEGERNGRAIDIVETVNMILTQRLIRSTNGGRVALREYLVFTDEIRDQMLDCPIEQLPALARELTKKHGQTFEDDAKDKYTQGLISEREYRAISSLAKGMDEDSTETVSGQVAPSVDFSFRGMSDEDIQTYLNNQKKEPV